MSRILAQLNRTAIRLLNFAITRPTMLKLFRRGTRTAATPVNRASRRSDLRDGQIIGIWADFLRRQRDEQSLVTVDPECCSPEHYAAVSQWYASRESHRVSRWLPKRAGRSRVYTGEMIWEATWVLAHGQLQPGLKILDVGAENSFLPIYLAGRGAEVFAVDKWLGSYGEAFEANILRRCFDRTFVIKVRRDDGSTGRVHYQNQDATHLGFPDNTFDRVITLSAVEHIVDDSAAVREMGRVLKPGGLFFLTTSIGPRWQQNSDTPHHKDAAGEWTGDLDRIYSADALFSRLIEPSGLKPVGECDFSVDWSNKVRHQMPGGSPDFVSVALALTKP